MQPITGREIMRNKMSECWSCKNKRPIPGDAHISCAKPDANMTGNKHGIRSGWFMYPFNFDPVWKEKLCDNYESDASVVSGVVSGIKAQ
jgi:hypothetical protein